MGASRCALAHACMVAVALLVTGAPTKFQGPTQRVASSSGCQTCRWLVKALKCEAADPDAQWELSKLVQRDVCPVLPVEMQAQCRDLTDAVISTVSTLLQYWSAAELCSDAQLCGAAPAQLPARPPANNLACPMCEYIMGTAQQALTDPVDGEALLAAAHTACSSLPPVLQAECKSSADRLGGQPFRLTKNVSPAAACTLAGACLPEGLRALSRLPPQLLPAALVGSLTGLKSSSQCAGNDLCDTCKTIILEAAAILSNVDTQRQVLEYAKEACSGLGAFKDQCVSYVELYGPLVINMVVGYLKPELCIQLSYCPPPSSAWHRLELGVPVVVAA